MRSRSDAVFEVCQFSSVELLPDKAEGKEAELVMERREGGCCYPINEVVGLEWLSMFVLFLKKR